jgi:hypothetical protein
VLDDTHVSFLQILKILLGLCLRVSWDASLDLGVALDYLGVVELIRQDVHA